MEKIVIIMKMKFCFVFILFCFSLVSCVSYDLYPEYIYKKQYIYGYIKLEIDTTSNTYIYTEKDEMLDVKESGTFSRKRNNLILLPHKSNASKIKNAENIELHVFNGIDSTYVDLFLISIDHDEYKGVDGGVIVLNEAEQIGVLTTFYDNEDLSGIGKGVWNVYLFESFENEDVMKCKIRENNLQLNRYIKLLKS